ncbi:uncharacterized protein [Epargyreus clarus]|uniref:uncharacterized protein n=1 Tax=Epargyreus clarus TaxID=520877 RepID=UPI003C2DD466
MNDIGIKIVDSPKDRLASPVAEVGCDNEVDPLSIDDVDGSIKDPLNVEVKTEVEDSGNVGSCDENAKDENVETLNKELDERLEEELLNEKDVPKDDEKADKLVETNIESVDLPETEPKASPEEVEKVKTPERNPSPIELKRSSPMRNGKSKETSPVKEVPLFPVVEVKASGSRDPEPDIDMTPVPRTEPKIDKPEAKPIVHPYNGDVPKEEQATRRRASEDIDTDSPLKRLCQEVERAFPQHDIMINDYIQTATKNNIEEIQRHTEQLLSEIQTLRELAQKKEHEWNNILHLKKVKEEILLRLLRRKQVLSFEKSADVNGAEKTDPFDYLNQAKNLAIDKSDEISGLSIKQPGSTMMNPMMQPPVMPVVTGPYNPMVGLPPPYDKAAHMQPLPKPMFPQPMLMPGPLPGFPRDLNGIPTSFGMPMGRQGPTKDVKSIIADYRQRNPEVTPRRGRRMRSIVNPNMINTPRPIAPKMDMNNLNNLNMLFNNLDMNQKAMLERLQQIQAGGLPNGVSFKDVLVQFANMQQAGAPLLPRPMEMPRPEHVRPDNRRRQERNEDMAKHAERLASPSPRLPPPPPYPEISLLPVSSSQDTQNSQNSLLHGILTKQACPASQCYSPTLAKLLKSPDRKLQSSLPTYGQAKNCGEITITPVQPTPPPPDPQPEKAEVVQLDDEESPGSEGETAEAGEAAASPGGSGCGSGSGSGGGGGRLVIDEAGDDTPLCQGCRRRDAQFVCAGCANQWYCSRDCQVSAAPRRRDHTPLCQGCRRRDAQFVCAGCANQWYCSRDCQVSAAPRRRDHTPLCQGCRRRDAQFVCAGCANQWYCSRDCQPRLPGECRP